MMTDEKHMLGGRSHLPEGPTTDAVLRLTRMSWAEAEDLHLFIAPARLVRSRRMLAAGLFAPGAQPAPDACNDNRN